MSSSFDIGTRAPASQTSNRCLGGYGFEEKPVGGTPLTAKQTTNAACQRIPHHRHFLMRFTMIAKTVSELTALLASLPPDAVVFSVEPPFSGVKLVPQDSGGVLVAPIRD